MRRGRARKSESKRRRPVIGFTGEGRDGLLDEKGKKRVEKEKQRKGEDKRQEHER